MTKAKSKRRPKPSSNTKPRTAQKGSKDQKLKRIYLDVPEKAHLIIKVKAAEAGQTIKEFCEQWAISLIKKK